MAKACRMGRIRIKTNMSGVVLCYNGAQTITCLFVMCLKAFQHSCMQIQSLASTLPTLFKLKCFSFVVDLLCFYLKKKCVKKAVECGEKGVSFSFGLIYAHAKHQTISKASNETHNL